jgi:phenylacetate-coenzyme A ligase PaaK-like adenylate-forming protein
VDRIVNNIFSVSNESFAEAALQVFNYQYANNSVYKQWVDTLNVDTKAINSIEEIPFLPISLFKSHKVVTGDFKPEAVFESSGTTTTVNSKHYIKSVEVYRRSFTEGFASFYGSIDNYCIIGLLPSYLERKGSSLIMMADELISLSNHPLSGFYLYDFKKLSAVLQQLEASGTKTMLIGVTFALLDFAHQFPMKLQHTTIMETGGMKGRGKEMLRQEVHDVLKLQLGVENVHAEYGMTELLSQSYSTGHGEFKTVPWLKVLVRDEEDPLRVADKGPGLLNIIDLANIYSCSFIATDDVGVIHTNQFEVIGRLDHSDVRGCSLMVSN